MLFILTTGFRNSLIHSFVIHHKVAYMQNKTHLDANQQVKDGNTGKWYQVAGEKDCTESEDSIKLRKLPVSVASNELKLPDGKTLLAVNKEPRYEKQCRYGPDEAY